MPINLTRTQIDQALPRVQEGLRQYRWLQSHVVKAKDFCQDREFRRRYNYFYRVRRAPAWQDAFYSLMARAKKEELRFPAVLDALYRATNRYEASFASKLVATLNPSQPVIDAFVLKNAGLHLPSYSAPNRAERICELYRELTSVVSVFLHTERGDYLVKKFRRIYPGGGITEVKMLDLVLWQTRQYHGRTNR